jgi:hypothetical protein
MKAHVEKRIGAFRFAACKNSNQRNARIVTNDEFAALPDSDKCAKCAARVKPTKGDEPNPSPLPYSVNYWGSNPEKNNDDLPRHRLHRAR